MRNAILVLGLILSGLLLFLANNQQAYSESQSSDTAVSVSAHNIWTDVTDRSLRVAGEQRIQATHFRTYALNKEALQNVLANAPLEMTTESTVILELPLPNGEYGRFRIVESPVMAPELAAKYPTIKTYAGQGIDDPTMSTRFDITPLGFHGLVQTKNGRVFIDPLTDQTTTLYMSYYTKNFVPDTNKVNQIEEKVEILEANIFRKFQAPKPLGNSSQLRTFRLALAANGEYTTHFGSKANAIAQMVTSINRVNDVYMRDLAIKFILIANNDTIVYEDPDTDPYFGSFLSENQNNLNSEIGAANYDIGHVLTTSSGGVASLGVVCKDGSKARGTTGLPNPVGDPFDIDYLSHEIGHQFGATHTFNGNTNACAGGNRTGSTAFEPGSGSTIMAYAGICGLQNLQNNSDPYFHAASIIQINSYLASQDCQMESGSNNNPTVEAGITYTIPISTPFTLTGTASDIDSKNLTYTWEEYDLGPAGNFDNPFTPSAPIFRSFDPTTSPARTFPQLSDILNNTQTKGEILPQVGRTLNFKLTVRDNQMIGATAMDDTQIVVEQSSGPFVITSWNTAVPIATGSQQTITWAVAKTNLPPVNCTEVDIFVSDDGGLTFVETAVASQVANNGSYQMNVPNIVSESIRFKIQCHNNIFFDINDANLSTATDFLYLPIIYSE